MFVSQSTHNDEVIRRIKAEAAFDEVLGMYNRLVKRINRLGGEKFLDEATLNDKPAIEQFDRSELNVLISLCHPDKHGGKLSANNMTQRLIVLRKKL